MTAGVLVISSRTTMMVEEEIQELTKRLAWFRHTFVSIYLNYYFLLNFWYIFRGFSRTLIGVLASVYVWSTSLITYQQQVHFFKPRFFVLLICRMEVGRKTAGVLLVMMTRTLATRKASSRRSKITCSEIVPPSACTTVGTLWVIPSMFPVPAWSLLWSGEFTYLFDFGINSFLNIFP